MQCKTRQFANEQRHLIHSALSVVRILQCFATHNNDVVSGGGGGSKRRGDTARSVSHILRRAELEFRNEILNGFDPNLN